MGLLKKALPTAAELEARRSQLEAEAQAAKQEASALRQGLDDLVLQPAEHRKRFLAVAAAEDREKRLKEMAAELTEEIEGARKREEDARMVAKSEDLRREGMAKRRLLADVYKRAAQLAADCDAITDYLHRVSAHNRLLREVGRHRQVIDGVSYTSRRPGFEDVVVPHDPDAARAEDFLHQILIPPVSRGGAPMFRGAMHR